MSSPTLPDKRISKSRAFNASLLTIITLLVFLMLIYHLIWAIKVVYYQPYGNFINNLVYGPGTVLANFGLSSKLIRYINVKLVEEKIEPDYKKYI